MSSLRVQTSSFSLHMYFKCVIENSIKFNILHTDKSATCGAQQWPGQSGPPGSLRDAFIKIIITALASCSSWGIKTKCVAVLSSQNMCSPMENLRAQTTLNTITNTLPFCGKFKERDAYSISSCLSDRTFSIFQPYNQDHLRPFSSGSWLRSCPLLRNSNEFERHRRLFSGAVSFERVSNYIYIL